jgi:hypothetical protein
VRECITKSRPLAAPRSQLGPLVAMFGLRKRAKSILQHARCSLAAGDERTAKQGVEVTEFFAERFMVVDGKLKPSHAPTSNG